jgi:hypothetical protein
MLLLKEVHLLCVTPLMERLFTIVPTVLSRRGLQGHAHASHVVHRSQEWLENRLPALRSCVKVHKFELGTLFIACTHSIAAQECYPLFGDLQDYLKRECHFTDVQTVRLHRN